MSVLGVDLGGTKLSSAVFSMEGKMLTNGRKELQKKQGKEVGSLICSAITELLIEYKNEDPVVAIGIAVPGISRQKTGTVWAPNIGGWEDYPLLQEVQAVTPNLPVKIESDRACYISGELWQGNAIGCRHAIYLAVGTGIGAGIVIEDKVLNGAEGIAGAIGWMALDRPFKEEYVGCGCFEYHASGEGIAKIARSRLLIDPSVKTELRKKTTSDITAHDVFLAYERGDNLALEVIHESIEFWGMALANLVSLFNPEKIILGGGVFGPATRLISTIQKEASRWAQPISMQQVKIESSKLGNDAGLYGAGFHALQEFHLHKAKYV